VYANACRSHGTQSGVARWRSTSIEGTGTCATTASPSEDAETGHTTLGHTAPASDTDEWLAFLCVVGPSPASSSRVTLIVVVFVVFWVAPRVGWSTCGCAAGDRLRATSDGSTRRAAVRTCAGARSRPPPNREASGEPSCRQARWAVEGDTHTHTRAVGRGGRGAACARQCRHTTPDHATHSHATRRSQRSASVYVCLACALNMLVRVWPRVRGARYIRA
jgi:hypothetical protein